MALVCSSKYQRPSVSFPQKLYVLNIQTSLSVTNEVPEFPVVSQVSGAVFEKRIIEKYIAENGCDPVNGKELKVENLIEIKVPAIVKPRPPSATSIPATLKTMQDEWDALMLHTFTLRQQLQTARQELSHALYQHDAACRVIARLNKEVMAAREALATLKPQAGVTAMSSLAQQPAIAAEAAGVATHPIEQAGMNAEVIQRLQDKATVLTQERKKRGRTVPEELMSQDQIKSFLTVASHPVRLIGFAHSFLFQLIAYVDFRVCIRLPCPAYWLWI